MSPYAQLAAAVGVAPSAVPVLMTLGNGLGDGEAEVKHCAQLQGDIATDDLVGRRTGTCHSQDLLGALDGRVACSGLAEDECRNA